MSLLYKSIHSFRQKKYHKRSAQILRRADLFRGTEKKPEGECSTDSWAWIVSCFHRLLKVRLTESQVACSLALSDGFLSELSTGEGKTFSIALASVYQSIFCGQFVHILTSNDYLAFRDYSDLFDVFGYFGLSVGCVTSKSPDSEKRDSYINSDIIYSTPSAIAFDYLKDSLSLYPSHLIQSGVDWSKTHCIMDEVDLSLVDYATVPFVVSGQSDYSVSGLWPYFVEWCREIFPGIHVYFDQEARKHMLNEDGYRSLERMLIDNGFVDSTYSVYGSRFESSLFIHMAYSVVTAFFDLSEGVDYVVRGGSVQVVSSSTGRIDKNRMWGDGIHQVIECRHNLDMSSENIEMTRMSITQFIRLYSSFSGSSGTLVDEAKYFDVDLGIKCVPIKNSFPDNHHFEGYLLFNNYKDKYKHLFDCCSYSKSIGQPVLVISESIKDAYSVSAYLDSFGLGHDVLTAENDHMETDLIAKAGSESCVTLSTVMASRGTDISIDGDFGYGLRVISLCRHSSPRIDRQVSGRAARCGLPGSSLFLVSLDDLWVNSYMRKKPFKVSYNGEKASKRKIKKLDLIQSYIGADNLNSRQSIIDFDHVLSPHHSHYLSARNHWLNLPDELVYENIVIVFDDLVNQTLQFFGLHENDLLCRDYSSFLDYLYRSFNIKLKISEKELNSMTGYECYLFLFGYIKKYFLNILAEKNSDSLRSDCLSSFNENWSSHLSTLDRINQFSSFQSSVQVNVQAFFIRMSFYVFGELLHDIEKGIVYNIFNR